jgi:hypothetical protein
MRALSNVVTAERWKARVGTGLAEEKTLVRKLSQTATPPYSERE